MNRPLNNPFAVEARYTEQRIPQYRGNALIGALPASPTDEQLAGQLFDVPEFKLEQRSWETCDRLEMVSQLSTFLFPLARHITLARAFDSLIKTGYARRGIRTPEHIATYQSLYEAQQEGKAFKNSSIRAAGAQLSSALIGWSGTGKTSAIRRIFSRYPEVIWHPEHDITQIPYLHIECPHDGISGKGLAASIFRKLDQLVPDCNYSALYQKSSAGAETLLNNAARALHNHYVGVLVVDEIQNLKNAGKSKTSLMSLLVSCANELNVPIVFVGTHKALNVLGIDMSPARRSSAAGFALWKSLERSGDLQRPEEWEDFITSLWRFQWNRKPVKLDTYLANFMFECCQGIPDIAIKLFACAQWRAMLNGDETFSIETLDAVMTNELVRAEPMLGAIRSNDPEAMSRYEDIAPLHFSSLLDDAMNAYEGVKQVGAAVTTGHVSFVPRVTSVLVEAGISGKRAESMAQKVAEEGKVVGIAEGARAALELAKPPSRARRKSKTEETQPAELAPDDYRNAVRKARETGSTVFDELARTGAARPLDELVGVGF
ncbi:hypothetical protein R8871_01414 [Paraburkholderia graminis C4D1M]|jgi:type II secretory pathway predicted ATPase ExeA|uniref:Putative transposition protein C n=1 Tax=Paraburkholderia graminis (strain ATCC 700544 / DSM 17151 / LMG 18924 / NCIMB 13744 / C4D1M) TaxID=396598 RepID=B1FTC1_PARG4|nr:AAA family ATPase [Paraburkholderia graminis]EDT12884.1 putative transposition protein C [Paraburkholderia graminis C4D1M]CAB3658883.1 hypothetical protein R8871_01414 [Paraburkholderia graminis C4D1M]